MRLTQANFPPKEERGFFVGNFSFKSRSSPSNAQLESAGEMIPPPGAENPAPFRTGGEAVRMFLRGPFRFAFFQAINAGRPGQYSGPLTNLWAVWGRFRRKQRSFRQGQAISARYAICAMPHKHWRLRILLIWQVGT